MRFLLTAEEFGAAEALRIGLAQEVVPAGSHIQRARELAQLIARQAPLGVQGTLANARVGRSQGPDAAREHLLAAAGILDSQDAAEGVRSFTERREGPRSHRPLTRAPPGRAGPPRSRISPPARATGRTPTGGVAAIPPGARPPRCVSPVARIRSRLSGALHGPFPGGARGDAAEVHPAGAEPDEHQDIQSLAQHGVHVQEVDREDPGSLGVQELPPGRAGAARRWIDAPSVQDLPDSGRGDRHAELGQLAVDAAMSP